MVESSSLDKKLHLRELELNSLLEITQAINANLPEESLYRIYHFTTLASLHIKKLALYVFEEDWNCKVNYGTAQDFKLVSLPSEIYSIVESQSVNPELNEFAEFDLILPVAHKNNSLAYVLLGGSSTELIDTSFIQTFTNILVVAIENKRLARKQLQQEALRKELEIAREVQTMLFPKELPHSPKLSMEATYLPHHSVGGDYYDYIPLDEDKFIVCIADVSGKGIPAALLMANFQASLRTLVRKTTDLKEIVEELNLLIKNNAKGERFITFFVAIINLKDKYLKYINAGHNPPVLLWQNGQSEVLEKGTTVLGAFDKLPFIEEDIIVITSAMLLFSYTDGLSEVSNEKDEEFGIEYIEAFLRANYQSPLKKMHQDLHSTINSFKGTKVFPDDITYMSCSFE